MDIICCVFEHFQLCSNNVHTWRGGFASLEWDYDLWISYVVFLNIFTFFSNNVHTWRDGGFASLEWDFCRILKWKAAAQVFSFFLYRNSSMYVMSVTENFSILLLSLRTIMYFYTIVVALLKFIYSEKATKFCEISTVDLTVTT